MLVLSRKIGEIITIGNSIEITVLSHDRGVVRLGISAPKSVPVHRKEVHDRIIQLNKQAAKTELQALKDALKSAKNSFNMDKDNTNSNLNFVNFSTNDK
ncbi:hypothetical protein MASR1M45_10240 [Candidatus Kapaibacterium sp.]